MSHPAADQLMQLQQLTIARLLVICEHLVYICQTLKIGLRFKQQTTEPESAENDHDGSCNGSISSIDGRTYRYGLLDKSAWPYWSVGALSSSNMFYSAGPINGCGQCFEVQCVNSGGEFAVRA